LFSKDGTSGTDNLNAVNGKVGYLFGGGGNDTLIGGDVMTFLNGGEGHDTQKGQAGNDVLVYDPEDRLIDGGAGINLLRLDDNTDLDLTLSGLNVISSTGVKLANISVLDLTGSGSSTVDGTLFTQGANDLSLSEDVVTHLSNLAWGDIEDADLGLAYALNKLQHQGGEDLISGEAPVLFVNGDSHDSVTFTDDASHWHSIGSVAISGSNGYSAYIPDAANQAHAVVLIQNSIVHVNVA
jgi:hypothetical protein